MTVPEMLEQMKVLQNEVGSKWTLSQMGALRCIHSGKVCCPVTWMYAIRHPERRVPRVEHYRTAGRMLGLKKSDINEVVRAADRGRCSNETLRKALRRAVGMA